MLRTLVIALLATAFAIPSEILENNAAVLESNAALADSLDVNAQAAPAGLDVNENFCFPCPFGGKKSSGHKSSGHKGCGSAPAPAPPVYAPAPPVYAPAPPCGPAPVAPAPVAPGPQKECVDIPDVKPSTVYNTQVREIVATRTVTDLKVDTSVETLVQTLTKTHYSTHTQLSYPEQTDVCTLTRKYVVWPGYTVTAARPGFTEAAHVNGGCGCPPTPVHHC